MTHGEWSFLRWCKLSAEWFSYVFWCCQEITATTTTTLYHRKKCQTAHAFKIPGNPRVNATRGLHMAFWLEKWVLCYISMDPVRHVEGNCRPGSTRRVHSGSCIFTAYIYYYYYNRGEHPPRHVTWAIKWIFCCYIQIQKIICNNNKSV